MSKRTRFLVVTSLASTKNAGETIEAAQRVFLDTIAEQQTSDVLLVENVPVVLQDTRGAVGKAVAIGEKLRYCQEQMIAHGWEARDIRGVRFGEDTIRKLFSFEEVKARHVNDLYEAICEMVSDQVED